MTALLARVAVLTLNVYFHCTISLLQEDLPIWHSITPTNMKVIDLIAHINIVCIDALSTAQEWKQAMVDGP